MMPNNVFNILSQSIPNMAALKNVQSPDEMAQYLLNSGRVTQDQVNRAKQMWNNPQTKQQIQNNPMFNQFFK